MVRLNQGLNVILSVLLENCAYNPIKPILYIEQPTTHPPSHE
jgi:hypothetical protein